MNIMGLVGRGESKGSCAYGYESSWTWPCTKSFVLTDITTSVELPSGRPAPLLDGSTIIYSILRGQPPPPPPDTENKKKGLRK